MPVHDWSRVGAGVFHDFHLTWNVEIKKALNHGVLPPDHYAISERIVGDAVPDALTLQAVAPIGAINDYALKQRSLVIRHASDDRVVAIIEVLSPANRSSGLAVRSFVKKAAAYLARGYHLLLLDLQPPSLSDPQGIHGALWEEIGADRYVSPFDKPLTVAAYSAGAVTEAYVEPVGVGDVLPEMPLFLRPESYVTVPLEATYQAAWRVIPRQWRSMLDAPAT